MLFDFDDIILIPSEISEINSRKEVNVFDDNGMLPLMTAPMDTVVNEDNWKVFQQNRITSIIPRNLNISGFISENKFRWYSYGINEFRDIFLNSHDSKYRLELISKFNTKFYALIDVANGHMQQLYDTVKQAKEKYGDGLCLMIGNVANPKTYVKYAELGVDYIRCGVGNGSACLTSENTGIGYPMASLISEIYTLKKGGNYQTKIVADGGFKKYADIIKAVALGADYVMLGSIFNKALESTGSLYYRSEYKHQEIEEFFNELSERSQRNISEDEKIEGILNLFQAGYLYKKYRGMSTKEVQQAWGNTELKTAEGISTYQKVEYTLEGWCQNFKDYLSSAMSYSNSKTLEEFKTRSKYELITPSAFKRYNK